MDKGFIAWLVILGIGFPLLNILLGELTLQLKRRHHPFAKSVRLIRPLHLCG